MTVLVVDDDELSRLFLVAALEDMGVQSRSVESGEEALSCLADNRESLPELVILDIGLPGMDGFEVATCIKAIAGEKHLPIIFLTAFDDVDILGRCLAVGEDFISKPVSVEVVTAKVKAHRRITRLYRQLDSQYQELRRYHHHVSLEHELVEAIFRRYIEDNFIEAENFRYHISPKSVFNGDILLAAYGPSDNLYILIGDVTGHGLPAAVGAMPVSPVFFTMVRKGRSVGVIAAELNKVLGKLLPDNMLMAACLLELNGAGDQVAVWSGGLPPAVMADSRGAIKQMIEPLHCPLGMLTEHEFSQDIQVYSVSPDDKIYLFTDGLEESRNEQGEMFGDSRLYGLFDGQSIDGQSTDGQSTDMYERILDTLSRFTGGVEQDDDITLAELSCIAPGAARWRDSGDEAVSVLPWSLRLKLGAGELKVANPVQQVVRLLSNAVGVDVHQDYISTILSELYANSLEHGLLGLDSSIKSSEDGFIEYYTLRKERLQQLSEGEIEITVSLSHDSDGSRVTVCVRDSGEGFDAEVERELETDAGYGRGIGIVRELCERVEYCEGGSCVTAVYRL